MLWAACCENDENGGVPYFESDYSVENPIRFEPQGGAADKVQEVRVVVRSNVSWTITSDAEEWCTVYPATGKDEGRFYVTAQVQDQPYPRSCSLIVRDGGGNIVATIPVNQGAPAKRSKSGAGDHGQRRRRRHIHRCRHECRLGRRTGRCRRRGVGNARQARPGSRPTVRFSHTVQRRPTGTYSDLCAR